MKKLVVAVLMGGPSSEHDISIESGENVVASLDKDKYDVRPVVIGRDRKWALDGGDPVGLDVAARYLSEQIDIVFVALHGPFGEDGRVQGFLDMLGVPYTGSGVCASSLAMDKALCKSVVSEHGISVPGQLLVTADLWQEDRNEILDMVEDNFDYPCIVKPVNQGSSVAMDIPSDRSGLTDAISYTLSMFPAVLVEEFIDGTEVTCAVLGSAETNSVRPLPVTEIVPLSNTYFDYDSKYTEGGADEIVPARLEPELTQCVQDIAISVHITLHCKNMSRSDMIIADGDVYFIEINTIPGMTRMSLYPKAAEAHGIKFPELLDMIIEDALSVHAVQTRSG